MPTMLQVNKELANQATIGYRYYYDGYLECLEDAGLSDESRDYQIYYFPIDMDFEAVEQAIANDQYMSRPSDLAELPILNPY